MIRNLRFLLPFLARYRVVYAIGAVCLLTSSLFKTLIPLMVGGAFDRLSTLITDAGDQVGSAAEIRSGIAYAAGYIVLIALGTAITRTISRLLLLGVSRRAVHDVRNYVFDHLLKLSPSFYVRHQTGHLMSRCVNDMTNVQSLMGPIFMYIAETVVFYVICLTFMWRINPTLMLVGFAPFPLFIGLARSQARKIQTGSRAAQEGLAEVSAKVDESLTGHMVIKSLGLQEQDLNRFSDHCSEYRRLNLGVTKARATLMPMMMSLTSLGALTVLVIGGPQVIRDEMSKGDFVAMIMYLQLLAAPTGVLGFVISGLQRGRAALERVQELAETEVTLQSPTRPVEQPITAGAVSVRDLTVVYQPIALQPHLTGAEPVIQNGNGQANGDAMQPRTVLDHVSFEVPAGSTLGIVGPTGAGKTTLIRAISRQLEIEPDRVFVDGTDVMDMTLEDVRASIGFVPQETFLFGASLRENVALGRPQATDAEVEFAVDTSQLVADLPQLPNGLSTLLGEQGVNLSGGQRQRTALARAVLLDPTVLILDDTLSAVDTHTADEIMARLRPMMEDRTTIIVAHRIHTIQHADHIIVMDEGRIVERGTHEELIAHGGHYASLYETQQLREALAAELGVDADEEVA